MKTLREKLLPYQNIIWDWNGTLLSDLSITHQVLCNQLKDHGLPEISVSDYLEYFRFPLQDYYSQLGFDVSGNKFAEINRTFQEYYDTLSHEAQLFHGTQDFLSDLHKQGKDLFILSLAQHDHLQQLVRKHDIFHFFQDVRGHIEFCGRSKVDLGKRLVHDHNLNPKTTVLVGDTNHDYEVAEALGINAFIIADGHQSYERLTRELIDATAATILRTRYG